MQDNELLAKQLGERLLAQKLFLTTAESCTGGGVAQVITAIAGSSGWFERGFVTYSNTAKQEMLSVPEDLLNKHGAVSEPVALAMARGALQHSQAQCSIAITGIAGPDGGTEDKPVGLVWFAWAMDDKIFSKCHVFTGDRCAVREHAVAFALKELLQRLSKDY